MTKIIDVLNIRNTMKPYRGGYSPATAYVLKLIETKGKIMKCEANNHPLTFDGLLKDGLVKPADEGGYYELIDKGKDSIDTYKKFNKRRYNNLKL